MRKEAYSLRWVVVGVESGGKRYRFFMLIDSLGIVSSRSSVGGGDDGGTMMT